MASSTTKKVVAHRFDREPIAGFANPASYLGETGIEVLSLNGTLSLLPYSELKAVWFVRDFDDSDAQERRTFLTRPKLDGLWVRMLFHDDDHLEGVLPNNLLQLDSRGFTVVPPDSNQRVFIPRAALAQIQVLGVIGSPLRSERPRKKGAAKDQIGLFE